MREASARAALVGLVLAGAAHCSQPHADATAEAGPVEPAFILTTPRTTSPTIALSNLDAEIADREARMRKGEPNAPSELVGRYLMRAKYVGRVEDLVAADAVSAQLVAAHDDDAKAHLTRAGALAGVHEFAAASAELDRAEAMKTPADAIRRARAGLLLAEGKTDEAAALVAVPKDDAPLEDLVLRAGIDAQLGQAAESDRLFELARSSYRDVFPFTVAWIDFEHSRALELAGERAKARAYLEEAVRVVPSYTHAVVHLAGMDPPDRALARLDGLARSDDPDVLAGTADALRRAGRPVESAAMAARAKARFDEVLARLPLAFADHAASFYLGVGRDPARALELARTNAHNRPTDEAVELWLSAAQAAGSHADTCAAGAAALARPHLPSALRERAMTAVRGCP